MNLKTNSILVLLVISVNITPLLASSRRYYKYSKSRLWHDNIDSSEDIAGVRTEVEHLPRAEKILPGHTLLKPAFGMLKSSVKFPLRDHDDRVVYGSRDNLGITYGKTLDRYLYTGFRKANENNLNRILLELVKSLNKQARQLAKQKKEKQLLRNSQKRRRYPIRGIAGIPREVGHLPRAEIIRPGHTLLMPAFGTLKSSAKYPLRDGEDRLVYGSLDNLGITYGKTLDRLLYTGFRKANQNAVLNDVLLTLVKSLNIQASQLAKQRETQSLSKNPQLILESLEDEDYSLDSTRRRGSTEKLRTIYRDNKEYKKYYADVNDFEKHYDKYKKYFKKYEDFDSKFATFLEREKIDDSSISSSSSETEANQGNPYTIHKNKYIQNWPWKFDMDGDHVNINPMAPDTSTDHPYGGAQLFNRKWWYYNQDDYLPFR